METTQRPSRHATDFGRLSSAEPAEVVRPGTPAEVLAQFARARRGHLQVAIRGVGHCAGGQSLVPGGICLNVRCLDRIVELDAESMTVTVEAGCTWRALMAHLLPRGFSVPVVTDWLDLTVGGTLSLGGVGSQSFRSGLQTDHLLEVDFVTFDGRSLRLSPGHHGALFDLVRGGLGQLGMITACRLRLVPAPRRVRLVHAFYRDSEAFRRDVAVLMGDRSVAGLIAHARAGDPDVFFAKHPQEAIRWRDAPVWGGGWILDLEITFYEFDDDVVGEPDHRGLSWIGFRSQRMSFESYVRRVPPILEGTTDSHAMAHPEIALLLPDAAACEVMANELARLTPEAIGSGTVLIVPLDATKTGTPLFPDLGEGPAWLFAVLATTPADDPGRAACVLDRHRQMFERAQQRGGSHYPCDSNQWGRGEAFWSRHFGDHWAALAAAKAQVDPAALLNPGVGIFESATGGGER